MHSSLYMCILVFPPGSRSYFLSLDPSLACACFAHQSAGWKWNSEEAMFLARLSLDLTSTSNILFLSTGSHLPFKKSTTLRPPCCEEAHACPRRGETWRDTQAVSYSCYPSRRHQINMRVKFSWAFQLQQILYEQKTHSAALSSDCRILGNNKM